VETDGNILKEAHSEKIAKSSAIRADIAAKQPGNKKSRVAPFVAARLSHQNLN